MKKEEMMVLGLAGIAVYMIVKAGGVTQAVNKFSRMPQAFLNDVATRYNTNPASQQTAMLAEQDSWFYP